MRTRVVLRSLDEQIRWWDVLPVNQGNTATRRPSVCKTVDLGSIPAASKSLAVDRSRGPRRSGHSGGAAPAEGVDDDAHESDVQDRSGREHHDVRRGHRPGVPPWSAPVMFHTFPTTA